VPSGASTSLEKTAGPLFRAAHHSLILANRTRNNEGLLILDFEIYCGLDPGAWFPACSLATKLSIILAASAAIPG
jgi:hypothetical protein